MPSSIFWILISVLYLFQAVFLSVNLGCLGVFPGVFLFFFLLTGPLHSGIVQVDVFAVLFASNDLAQPIGTLT